MTFFDSKHCDSMAHCHKCRDLNDGRTWRTSIMAGFEDVTEADFACPKNLKWGQTDLKKAVKFEKGGAVTINGKKCIPCTEKRKARREAAKRVSQ